MFDVRLSDEYVMCVSEFARRPGGTDVNKKAKKVQKEAAKFGRVESFQITTRTDQAVHKEVYDLGDGFSLIAQLLDVNEKARALLFVGDEDSAEEWLEENEHNYWVVADDGQKINSVRVSPSGQPSFLIPEIDTSLSETRQNLSLLSSVDENEWEALNLPQNQRDYLGKITVKEFQQNPSAIKKRLEELSTEDFANFGMDILFHANKKEWESLHARIALETGKARIVKGDEATASITAPANCDKFVTFEDLDSLDLDFAEWRKWMLFLHPKQKELVDKSYKGPARLRGVSGSGKTCVMVHRARRLARLYQQPMLLIALTGSMQKLLDHLVRQLCGPESTHLQSKTMNSLAVDILEKYGFWRGHRITSRHEASHVHDKANYETLKGIYDHSAFQDSTLERMERDDRDEYKKFVYEEIQYVRQRFLPEEYDDYFKAVRHGRPFQQFRERARSLILAGARARDAYLCEKHFVDHDGIIQNALKQMSEKVTHDQELGFRCIFVDEVQDLSQLEIRLLTQFRTPTGSRIAEEPDGIYLVGDGAQTVYKKGFSLRSCGLDVSGRRSVVLKKNYRNTKETLTAAYRLICDYEFADVDEDNFDKPTEPDMSSRRGELPLIVKCENESIEIDFVVKKIREILQEQKSADESLGVTRPTEIPIGVIGFNQRIRSKVSRALAKNKIHAKELKENVEWRDNSVKVSSVESAKGHEFHTVFLIGLQEGVMPNAYEKDLGIPREAAKMYVAMTRCREELFMTYSIDRGKRPSRFLSSIQDHCNVCAYEHGELASIGP